MAASVVIVSDEPALCDRLEAPLTAAGWEVRRSRRTSAGERARETRQTAWVIDARGNLGGALELLRLLRALGRRFAPLSLALMDTADPAVARSLLDAGAHDVALASSDPHELACRLTARVEPSGGPGATEDSQLLLELTRTFASSLDFHEILYTVVRRIAEVTQVARVSIVLAPREDGEHVGYVVAASDDVSLINRELDLHKYPEIERALETRTALTVSDVATHPIFDAVRDDVLGADVASVTLLPIVWEQDAIGVLFVRAASSRGALSDREAHFCQIVANATAIALRNARAIESLRRHNRELGFARLEAERHLRSLERFADMFASTAEGIAVFDKHAELVFANPRAYELAGYSAGSVRRPLDFIAERDRELVRRLWRDLAEQRYARDVDVRIVRGDGTEVICNSSFAPLGDNDGSIVISFHDVTDQRRTEANLIKTSEFLRSIVETSVDGITAATLDGEVVLFNPAAERIYGVRADEVIGKRRWASLYPEGVAAKIRAWLHSSERGPEGQVEPTQLDVRSETGEPVPVLLSAALSEERGGSPLVVTIFTDLRAQRAAEARLAEAHQQLVRSEKQALIAELAGTAAHELNQPLTSIMAYADMLQRRLPRHSSEAGFARTMLSEAERMSDIVRKIGKITKYETTAYVGEQKIIDLDRAGTKTVPPGER
ncbi:MAG: PAS domain S-box protein [Myxococcales bacterium]|nr:PAS domain S-box protein [Myxococcales bacterium]